MAAVGSRTDAVAALTQGHPATRTNVAQLRPQIDAKMCELRETIDLRRTQGVVALAVVATDRGKIGLDAIGAQAAVMRH